MASGVSNLSPTLNLRMSIKIAAIIDDDSVGKIKLRLISRLGRGKMVSARRLFRRLCCNSGHWDTVVAVGREREYMKKIRFDGPR